MTTLGSYVDKGTYSAMWEMANRVLPVVPKTQASKPRSMHGVKIAGYVIKFEDRAESLRVRRIVKRWEATGYL